MMEDAEVPQYSSIICNPREMYNWLLFTTELSNWENFLVVIKDTDSLQEAYCALLDLLGNIIRSEH